MNIFKFTTVWLMLLAAISYSNAMDMLPGLQTPGYAYDTVSEAVAAVPSQVAEQIIAEIPQVHNAPINFVFDTSSQTVADAAHIVPNIVPTAELAKNCGFGAKALQKVGSFFGNCAQNIKHLHANNRTSFNIGTCLGVTGLVGLGSYALYKKNKIRKETAYLSTYLAFLGTFNILVHLNN